MEIMSSFPLLCDFANIVLKTFKSILFSTYSYVAHIIDWQDFLNRECTFLDKFNYFCIDMLSEFWWIVFVCVCYVSCELLISRQCQGFILITHRHKITRMLCFNKILLKCFYLKTKKSSEQLVRFPASNSRIYVHKQNCVLMFKTCI